MQLAIQIIITVSGLLALFLTTRDSSGFKLNGAIIGLLGQPFWIYTAVQNQQWGVLIMALCFAGVYIDIALRQLRARPPKGNHWRKA